ncbi:MAG: hypothetical protein Q4G33_04550 [bacterium]|nr:hypothetical protein [bacterium]
MSITRYYEGPDIYEPDERSTEELETAIKEEEERCKNMTEWEES